MSAPLAFLATPAGQALLAGLMEEAPKLFGKVLGIWGKSGAVSAEEIARFVADYKPSSTFYGGPSSYTGATGSGSSVSGAPIPGAVPLTGGPEK